MIEAGAWLCLQNPKNAMIARAWACLSAKAASGVSVFNFQFRRLPRPVELDGAVAGRVKLYGGSIHPAKAQLAEIAAYPSTVSVIETPESALPQKLN
jgi:hypothetical protein